MNKIQLINIPLILLLTASFAQAAGHHTAQALEHAASGAAHGEMTNRMN